MSDELEILMAKQERYAVASLFSEQQLVWPPFIQGQAMPVSISSLLRVKDAPDNRIWKYEDISGSAVRIGIGLIDEPPVAGSWVWTFGADSIVLSYNDTAEEIEAAVNAGAAMTSAGGCTIRKEGEVFIYTFNVAGVRADVTGNPDNLSPPSIVDFGIVQEGTVSLVEIGTFQLIQRPVGLDTLADDIETADGGVEVVAVGGAGVNHKVRVTLTGQPYGGSFNLNLNGNVTDSVTTTTTEAEFVAKVEALANVGAGNVSCLIEDEGQWLLTFIAAKSETDMGTAAGDFSALLSRLGKKGEIDLQSANLQLLFKGDREKDGYVEIEITPSGGSPRKYQQAIKLINAMIDPSTTGPVNLSQYYTQAEMDALLDYKVHVHPEITGLSGGGATKLDGIVTAGGVAPKSVIINAAGYARQWELLAGTAATVAGVTQRPADYAGGTNERYWSALF